MSSTKNNFKIQIQTKQPSTGSCHVPSNGGTDCQTSFISIQIVFFAEIEHSI